MLKPADDLRHGPDAPTAILLPGFLCNQGVTVALGKKLAPSMNVVYPNIGILDYSHRSLFELADKIAEYVGKLESEGKLAEGGRYTIIGHSMGGNLALLVANKLRVRHLVQVSTPNQSPAVAEIVGLGIVPALFDLRNISEAYENLALRESIDRLTSITPQGDKFVGTDTQGVQWLPENILIREIDPIPFPGGHLDPILTDAGISTVAKAVRDGLPK
jgi:pimeloyl-ACP methyl ester carboxylesterase